MSKKEQAIEDLKLLQLSQFKENNHKITYDTGSIFTFGGLTYSEVTKLQNLINKIPLLKDQKEKIELSKQIKICCADIANLAAMTASLQSDIIKEVENKS